MSPRLFGRLGEDMGFSVPPLASTAGPRRPAAPPACPPRAPAPPPPALAGCAAVLLSGCAGRRPPSVRENMRFLVLLARGRAPSPEEGAPPRRKPRSAESAGPMRRRNGADSCQNSDCWPEIASARTWRGKRAACGSGEPVARNRGHANMKGRWGAACWRRSRGVGEDAGGGATRLAGMRRALRGCDCGVRHALLHRESDPCEGATMRMRKGGATQEALE